MNAITRKRLLGPAAALAMVAGTCGTGFANPIRSINLAEKNYNEGRTNTANRSIVAYHGNRNDGRPVLGLWNAADNAYLEAASPEVDTAMGVETYAFVQTRGPGDPLKGISIGLIKKPRPAAFYWNTENGGNGSVHMLDDLGYAASWATAADATGRIIGGAVYGPGPGGVESPRAVVWDHDTPTLLAVPTWAQASEVNGISSDGTIRVGTVSPSASPRPQPKAINEPRVQVQGIVWSLAGMTIVDPAAAGPDCNGLAFIGLGPDNDACYAAISTTRSNAKGSAYRISTGSFTIFDGGDINGDGIIDLMDDHDSALFALSLDSSLAGGSITIAGNETAMIWLGGTNGYESMDALAFLGSRGVTGLAGWNLTQVTGISLDGTMLSGWGVDPSGYTTVWHATIPTPGTLGLIGIGGALAARRRR